MFGNSAVFDSMWRLNGWLARLMVGRLNIGILIYNFLCFVSFADIATKTQQCTINDLKTKLLSLTTTTGTTNINTADHNSSVRHLSDNNASQSRASDQKGWISSNYFQQTTDGREEEARRHRSEESSFGPVSFQPFYREVKKKEEVEKKEEPANNNYLITSLQNYLNNSTADDKSPSIGHLQNTLRLYGREGEDDYEFIGDEEKEFKSTKTVEEEEQPDLIIVTDHQDINEEEKASSECWSRSSLLSTPTTASSSVAWLRQLGSPCVFTGGDTRPISVLFDIICKERKLSEEEAIMNSSDRNNSGMVNGGGMRRNRSEELGSVQGAANSSAKSTPSMSGGDHNTRPLRRSKRIVEKQLSKTSSCEDDRNNLTFTVANCDRLDRQRIELNLHSKGGDDLGPIEVLSGDEEGGDKKRYISRIPQVSPSKIYATTASSSEGSKNPTPTMGMVKEQKSASSGVIRTTKTSRLRAAALGELIWNDDYCDRNFY